MVSSSGRGRQSENINTSCIYQMLPLSQVLGRALRRGEGRRSNTSLRRSWSRGIKKVKTHLVKFQEQSDQGHGAVQSS